ncbi:MAG TPA: hypothetical protein VJS65_16195, partial [Verrucomicrobiae bacterium]|nr:hypothetical protein [Verrucomicrobiae bacterium]
YGNGVIPPPTLSNVMAIATSASHDVVITSLPGPPSFSYLNQAYTFSDGPFAPVPGVFNVQAVAVEGDRIMAVTSDGRVVTSGFPPNWLADGTVDSLTNVVAVGLNYTGGAALTADGRVIEVGRPSFQKPEVTNAIAIDVSGQFNDDDLDFKIAVTSDQWVVAWGLYEFSSPPSAEIPGLHSAAAGWNHIVALIQDGTVVEWDSDTPPTVVAGVSNVVKVAAGGEHSVALKNNGTVVAWGDNSFGQTDVPAGLSNVWAISAAEYHTLAVKGDGTLVAWGKFYLGEDATPPQNLSNVVAIATSASQDIVISYLRQPATLGIAVDGSDPNKAIISLSGAPNREYLIEASADFVNWQFVRNVLNLTGSTTFPVETTDASLRFFRAR